MSVFQGNTHELKSEAENSEIKPSCAVLYLDRFANGSLFPKMFLNSMSRFSAGYNFDYFHVFKGYNNSYINYYKKYKEIGNFNRFNIVSVDDKNLPFSSFYKVLKDINHEKVMLFLSWSRILADNWLKFYIDAFASDSGIGVVGATGSYERRDYRDLSLPFPNAGLRTNAFMIDRKLYLELTANVVTRAEELDFESGPDSLTRQIARRGMRPVVVDRYGKIWEVPEWPNSRTFRSGNQEGLLIADNRTHDYERSTTKKRKKLSKITWGHEEYAEPARFLERTWVDFRWKYHRRRLRQARAR